MSVLVKINAEQSVPVTIESRGKPHLASASAKLLGLEILRFASALAVLIYHYNHFMQIPGTAAVAFADVPFYNWLWPLYDHGQLGVQLFWGISGYIFFWNYGQAIHAGKVSPTRFFWLRFSRLYPLHLATLIMVAGLQILHRQLTGGDYVFAASDISQFFLQVFLATDWGAVTARSFNGPIWSVSAEVAVYAGFFLLLRRYPPTLKMCLGVAVVGLALQLYGFDIIPTSCAIFFFTGGMAAQVSALRWPTRAAAGAVASCIVLGAGSLGLFENYSFALITLLFALPLLLVALAGELPLLDRFQRGIQAVGNLTYSTYLLSFPLQLMLAVVVAGSGFMPDITNPAFLLAYLAVVLVAGAVCYRAFELPAQNWIRRRMLAGQREKSPDIRLTAPTS